MATPLHNEQVFPSEAHLLDPRLLFPLGYSHNHCLPLTQLLILLSSTRHALL